MKRAVLLFILLLPLLAHAQPSDPGHVFGVVEGYYRPGEAAALGVSWDRVVFSWNRFQPNGPDEFDASSVPDSILNDAAAAGRQIVGVIKATPAWASDTGTPAGVPRGLALAHDDPANTFGQFVRRLVEAYAPRGVHHWVIWNEPDMRPGEGIVEFEGEVEDYALLLRTGYLAARAVDPAAHIQIAGMTWWYDVNAYREPYLARLLRVVQRDGAARANGWFFDGISLHIYFTTSSVGFIIRENQRILRAYGLSGKDVWLSEFNASPRRDPAAAIGAPFQVSLEQQADFVVQAAALALANGVDRMAVYRLWDNDFVPGVAEPWGLVRADGSLRPAWFAYQQVIRRMQGGRAEHFARGGGDLVTIAFPDRTLYVMWSADASAGEFVLLASEMAEVAVADAVGNVQSIAVTDGQAVIAAPGAEMIDANFVVVAGAARLVELAGAPRTVRYRGAAGQVTLR